MFWAKPSTRAFSRGLRFTFPVAAASLALGIAFAPAAQNATATNSKIKIAFIGDSTADGLWGGVTNLLAHQSCMKGAFELGRFAKNSTGLTRRDKYDWPKETAIVAANYKPDLFIVSLGLNDRQPIVDPTAQGRHITMNDTPEWTVRYKEQVLALLKSAAEAKVPVLWVGLAAMRDSVVNRDAQQKNTIFADAIAQLGVPNIQFVPPWRLNQTGEDVFASYAPGKDGKMVHIRTSDGEHFTSEGDEIVANYILPRILATLKEAGVPVKASCQLASE